MCFFFGGLNRPEQYFNTTVAQTAASLLALAVASVIVPTAFDLKDRTPQSDVAKLSRGTAVILLIVYGAYLFFQLKTHSMVFAQESQKVEAKPFKSLRAKDNLKEGAIAQGIVAPGGILGGHSLSTSQTNNIKLHDAIAHPPPSRDSEDEEDEGEEPQLSFPVALATLCIATAFIGVCQSHVVYAGPFFSRNSAPECQNRAKIADEHRSAPSSWWTPLMLLRKGVLSGTQSHSRRRKSLAVLVYTQVPAFLICVTVRNSSV